MSHTILLPTACVRGSHQESVPARSSQQGSGEKYSVVAGNQNGFLGRIIQVYQQFKKPSE